MTSPYPLRSPGRGLPVVVSCLLVLGAGAGCHIVDPSEDAANGCAAYADDACQVYARCGAAFLAPFGTIGSCNRQVAESCTKGLAEPDGIGSGAGAAACGELLLALDCNAILNGELPPGCQAPAGRRSDGVPCNVGAQCASARCAKPTLDSSSGECRERVALGEPCLTIGDCQQGMFCSAKNACVVLGQDGQPCSDAAPCRAPLACGNGRCTLQPIAAACTDPQKCPDDATACQAFAAAICARLDACAPAVITSEYGDRASCTARNARACVLGLHSPDGVSSGAGIAVCTDALAAVSCHGLLENATPPDCRIADGARQNGQGCSSNAECASTRCARAANAACGTCSTLALVQEACTVSSDCSSGLVCSQAGLCLAPAGLGASCDAAHPCAFPLSCARGICETALGADAPCQWDDDRCDRYAGLLCGSSKTCTPWLNASTGQPCGSIPGGWTACSAGATCSSMAADGGVCEGPLSDGSACRTDGGPSCLAPALCIAGVCTIASPVVCP